MHPTENQQEGIDLVEKVSGGKVDVTNIKTGHIPNESQPQLVIEWILDVVRKAEGSRQT